jgi:crotonobetainyl-CoA:carnitine CoA-transferase CaiB-like acyl-CoA transferase
VGGLTGGLACYNVYATRDGRAVSLAALESKFWTNFCDAVRRPDLVDDYLAPSRQDYLMSEVAGIFALHSADEWDAMLRNADCCYAPINAVGAIGDDPHVQARGLLSIDENGVPWMRSPLRLESPPSGAVPDYGQHTRAVLREAGYADAEIDALYAAGVAQG